MSGVPAGVSARVFARTFLIQGSWNYRTMIGTGMAFALLPLLRYLHGSGDELDGAVARQAEHFNAHPYLAGLAVGALTRLEEEGAPPEVMRRFRAAVGGPLGALGDRVVWATWLPFSALVGLVAAVILGPWWGAAGFLALYNAGHLALRWWAYRTGMVRGTGVATRLKEVGLADRARALEGPVVVLGGVLVGLLVGGGGEEGGSLAWGGAQLLALAAGALLGSRSWRPAALVVVLAVGGLLVPGWVS